MTSTPYTTTDAIQTVVTPSPVVGASATDLLGFFGATASAKPTVTGVGATGSSAHSLCAALATLGLIIDSTTTT